MQTYLYTFRPLRDRFMETMDAQEQAAFHGHVGYTEGLLKQGKLVFKGAAINGSLGIVVFEANDPEEAATVFSGDPATQLGSLECQCQPFFVAGMRSREA